jgi:hypothetical protein
MEFDPQFMQNQMLPPLPQLSMFHIRKRSGYETVMNQIPTIQLDSTLIPSYPQPIIRGNMLDYPDPTGLMITENSSMNKQYGTIKESYSTNSELLKLVQPYNHNQNLGDVNLIAQEGLTKSIYTLQDDKPRYIDTYGRESISEQQFSEPGDNPITQINRDEIGRFDINKYKMLSNYSETPETNYILYS